MRGRLGGDKGEGVEEPMTRQIFSSIFDLSTQSYSFG